MSTTDETTSLDFYDQLNDENRDFNTIFEELISKAKVSDQGREQLFAFLLPHVEKITTNHLKFQIDLIDDVVQESMIAIMSAGVETMKFPRAYLATVVRRTAMRLVGKIKPHDELMEGVIDERDDLEQYEDSELMKTLSEIIDGMKSRCRRLLDMLSFKTESNSDLAKELEMKEDHVSASRYACLKSLRKKLETKHPSICEDLKNL